MSTAFLLTLWLVCTIVPLAAQDLLVNSGSDSLNIYTIKIAHGDIHFRESGKTEKTFFPANRIQLYIPDYFDAQQPSTDSDLLIKSNGDSLKVGTIKIERGFIQFREADAMDVQRYAVNRIQLFIPKYFSKQNPISSENSRTEHNAVIKTTNAENTQFNKDPLIAFPIVRISAQVGWSQFTGRLDPDMIPQDKSHTEGLRTGIHNSVALELFPYKYFGIGVGYSYFGNSHQTKDYKLFDANNSVSANGWLRNEFRIHHGEIRLTGRYPFARNRFTTYAHVAAGRVWYNDLVHFTNIAINAEYLIKSESFTMNTGLGLDFRLNDSFSIGLQSNLMIATASEFYVKSFDGTMIPLGTNHILNISRIDIGIGVRWTK